MEKREADKKEVDDGTADDSNLAKPDGSSS